ncbi:hypothetical protein PPERSA_06758 [Pseudocohnilembus persalinus]|uniref:Uncharacterized protein n=1 Tax=Pseudocohnilembus persalinus TaxID=266149 RepID=A0A0V0QSE3_PSEPJ|nr:hypothetical protein PPERSA_06758 [Pseudocohnilembus persalinus]|eukprot:KRX05124.1 hypothetical protein PPERSA_06758 [Pseudocohnilembus persalinus]
MAGLVSAQIGLKFGLGYQLNSQYFNSQQEKVKNISSNKQEQIQKLEAQLQNLNQPNQSKSKADQPEINEKNTSSETLLQNQFPEFQKEIQLLINNKSQYKIHNLEQNILYKMQNYLSLLILAAGPFVPLKFLLTRRFK